MHDAVLTRRFVLCLGTILLFAGCGPNPNGDGGDGTGSQAPGVLTADVALGKVGALAKSSGINLSKLIITLVSGTTPADTVRDTTSISGNGQLTVSKRFDLKPLRSWTLSARTLDSKDSVVHLGSTAPFFAKPGDTVTVSLNLTARFAMYEARFKDLPDSIASTAAGTGKEGIRFKRVVMKVDGVVRADSVSATYFNRAQVVKLFFDYVTPGTHAVILEAHGEINKYSGILYSGNASFDVVAGADDSRSVNLSWVGPTTGTGRLTVIIGKVGKIVINGTLPGTVFD